MKVYISGKISGIENEAPELFENAENYLISMGHEPVNPMKLNHNHDKSWASYMKEDVKALCDCDAIYLLSNWNDSKGSIIEHAMAEVFNMKIINQTSTPIIL